MLSLDSPEKNAEFAKLHEANFPVLSDPNQETARRYGVLGLTKLAAQRWTFYVDREGVVRHIEKDVDARNAGAQMARTLAELDFPRRP